MDRYGYLSRYLAKVGKVGSYTWTTGLRTDSRFLFCIFPSRTGFDRFERGGGWGNGFGGIFFFLLDKKRTKQAPTKHPTNGKLTKQLRLVEYSLVQEATTTLPLRILSYRTPQWKGFQTVKKR